MSRNKKSGFIETPRHHVRVGRKVLVGQEFVALVGPGKNKDTISVDEFVKQLYGPGYKCAIIPPEEKA